MITGIAPRHFSHVVASVVNAHMKWPMLAMVALSGRWDPMN
jgi:hypothetical protein